MSASARGPARPVSDYPPVVVLLGGPSAEHDVSIVSGTAIAEALGRLGLRVQPVLIDLAGRWWWLPVDHRRAGRSPADYDAPAALGADGPHPVGAAVDRLTRGAAAPLVFIALHGPFGEDGTIQGVLQAAGVAYTGSGVAASAIGMDKALFKRLARGLGLPVPDWREIGAGRWRADPRAVLAELEAFAAACGDPRLMIKPARLGSSVGMTLAHVPAERGPALEEAFRFDSLALAEVYVAGARDMEVSVLGNDPGGLELYGPGEIISRREFYDYQAKYTPGLSETRIVAELEPRQREVILKLARDAYRAVGAADYARVDFLATAGRIWLSEINTIPGFTPISLFPSMPAAGGYDFAGVCLRIVDLALARVAAGPARTLLPEDLPR